MTILVTGASGFIGNHVLKYLSSNTDHNLIATARNHNKVVNKTWYKTVKFIEADIYESKDNWFNFFHKPDLLIHLAWSDLPNYTKSFHITHNLPKDIIFLENILENGLKRVTVTGTCFEYGMQEGELNENLPTYPANPYAIAKDTLRRFLEYKTKSLGVDLKWLRLFYMYGEGQSSNSILSQLHSSLDRGEKVFNMSGGEQIRDYLPVEKVAEYIVKTSLNNSLTGVINISSGKPVRLSNFVKQYLTSIGKEIELNLGYYPYSSLEPMEFWGDNNKLKQICMESKSA
jgi:nucleoside-diphosphate-sugar epimerase